MPRAATPTPCLLRAACCRQLPALHPLDRVFTLADGSDGEDEEDEEGETDDEVGGCSRRSGCSSGSDSSRRSKMGDWQSGRLS